jgi:hypothetical protein
VIKSETHCTRSLKTSSIIENASLSGVLLSMIFNILSFGIVIKASTFSFNLLKPSIAWSALLFHSKENGFVTTQTVKAHNSFAISATTGVAQVQVQPQRPHVINTMSAQSKADFISS